MSRETRDLASAGFAAGERYEQARPGYPQVAVDTLCAACGIGPGRRVLDLAAGTGKLTRELVARGADVIAVEPTAGMRDQLVAAGLAIHIRTGTAEQIPVADGGVDVVTVGQAFHWFDAPRALAEIRRTLAPGGAIGLVWNVMDRSVGWVDRLQTRIHRHRGLSPWYTGHEWRSAFTGGCGFTPLEHRAFRNHQLVDVEGVVERVASVSFIATLPEQERAEVLADVRQLATEAFPGGDAAIPYVTDVFWAVRIDS
jgi:SAM-dependent methyltransferase